jgi:hypothetical protein
MQFIYLAMVSAVSTAACIFTLAEKFDSGVSAYAGGAAVLSALGAFRVAMWESTTRAAMRPDGNGVPPARDNNRERNVPKSGPKPG